MLTSKNFSVNIETTGEETIGYTHYWYLSKNIETKRWQSALLDCRFMVERLTVKYSLCGGWGEIRTKPELEKGLSFNGCDENAHETFILGENPEDVDTPWSKENETIFSFCKTARKPYDVIVVACLAALADVLGDDIEVYSDGKPADFEAGVELASEQLHRKIKNPLIR